MPPALLVGARGEQGRRGVVDRDEGEHQPGRVVRGQLLSTARPARAADIPPPQSAGQCGTAYPAWRAAAANQALLEADELLVGHRRSAPAASRPGRASRHQSRTEARNSVSSPAAAAPSSASPAVALGRADARRPLAQGEHRARCSSVCMSDRPRRRSRPAWLRSGPAARYMWPRAWCRAAPRPAVRPAARASCRACASRSSGAVRPGGEAELDGRGRRMRSPV